MRVIVVVAVAALAACKGKSEPTAGSAAPPPVATADAAAAPPADATAAPDAAPASGSAGSGSGEGSDDADTKLFETESLGGLRPGTTEDQAITILGAPKSRTKPVLEGATGAYVSSWSWANASLDMTADKAKGPWVARLVTVTAMPFETKQHVHVGSSRKDVEAAYKRSADDDGTKKDQYLVGSMYGGLLFTFKGDKVTSISIGPFAF